MLIMFYQIVKFLLLYPHVRADVQELNIDRNSYEYYPVYFRKLSVLLSWVVSRWQLKKGTYPIPQMYALPPPRVVYTKAGYAGNQQLVHVLVTRVQYQTTYLSLSPSSCSSSATLPKFTRRRVTMRLGMWHTHPFSFTALKPTEPNSHLNPGHFFPNVQSVTSVYTGLETWLSQNVNPPFEVLIIDGSFLPCVPAKFLSSTYYLPLGLFCSQI